MNKNPIHTPNIIKCPLVFSPNNCNFPTNFPQNISALPNGIQTFPRLLKIEFKQFTCVKDVKYRNEIEYIYNTRLLHQY